MKNEKRNRKLTKGVGQEMNIVKDLNKSFNLYPKIKRIVLQTNII